MKFVKQAKAGAVTAQQSEQALSELLGGVGSRLIEWSEDKDALDLLHGDKGEENPVTRAASRFFQAFEDLEYMLGDF